MQELAHCEYCIAIIILFLRRPIDLLPRDTPSLSLFTGGGPGGKGQGQVWCHQQYHQGAQLGVRGRPQRCE